ncbi:MAG: hypothetical protein KIT58_14315, partial [Planctomycetota bacterium]|nr:hypothetical protein [Planctomycetota bacterium]
MMDSIKKYTRAFLVSAAVAGVFAFPATPVFADPENQSAAARQQAPQQTFQISGVDSQRGPFTGQITLQQRPDGRVDVQREVTFQQSGETLTQAGVGEQRGNEVRARITQSQEQGLAGSLGNVASPNQSSQNQA